MRERKSIWITAGITTGVLVVALIVYMVARGGGLPDGEYRGSHSGFFGSTFTVNGDIINVRDDYLTLELPNGGFIFISGYKRYRYTIKRSEIILTTLEVEVSDNTKRTRFGFGSGQSQTFDELIASGAFVRGGGTAGRESILLFEKLSDSIFMIGNVQYTKQR
jgi:hypothetical protein